MVDTQVTNRLWMWASRFVLVTLVPLSTCAYEGWRRLDNRVGDNALAIEQLRMSAFTQEQGLVLEQRILNKLAEPPRWLTDSVSRLERAAERIDQQVAGMKERLARIEQQLNGK